jgi:Tfp pilus assembly protein PilN
MIRVNLIGQGQAATKSRKPKARKGGSMNLLPVLWVAVLAGSAVYGYLWYTGLTGELETIDTSIAQAEAQRAQLATVIAEGEVYEGRLAMLQSRIAAIESLQRTQGSPVVALDMVSRALEPIEYVWLSSLSQDNTEVSMSGTGTSQFAIADFMTSLENTGYFRNVSLGSIQASGPDRFTFNLSCDFVPPGLVVPGLDMAEGD